jgi:hypothetical protein
MGYFSSYSLMLLANLDLNLSLTQYSLLSVTNTGRCKFQEHLYLPNLLLLDHIAQWALLHHQTHKFIERIRSCHSCMLSIGIVRRSDLYNVYCHKINAFQATENRT